MTKLILDELRHLILHQVGIRNLSPSDCQLIAAEITRKTKKNISETTIKRIFGFAAANHQFSKFTINTLLAFTEDNETPSILNLADKESALEVNDTPSYLAIKAKVVSEHTLQKIVDACNIPYEYTINRKFAEHDFDYFYQSDYSFTAFIAQSGYGKSILLSHIVKNSFLNKGSKYENDIVLFLQAERIFCLDTENQNLENAIFEILGINTLETFIDYFNHIYKVSGRKLVLIFDSFYDLCQKSGAKVRMFNSIVQLLVNIEDNESIKLVLSMRTYIWRRFFDTVRHSIYLKSKWFTGSYYRSVEQTNVPLLTLAEIDQLLSKINIDEAQLPNASKSELKYPSNFSFFYQLKDEYKSNDYKSKLIFYEISLKYLNIKIYQSSHSVEKLILCGQLIKLSDYGRKGEMVNKNLLMSEFTKFRSAYMELLLDGILAEEKYNTNGFSIEYIRFIHQNVFEYFLFKELLEEHRHQIDNNLLHTISDNYLLSKNYMPLFQWSIFQMIKHNQFENIKYIFTLDLPPKDFTQLLLFFTENIKNKLKSDPNSIALLKAQSFHQEFSQKLVYLDFLDPSFISILNLFSEITIDETSYLLYQSILNLHDCLSINIGKLQDRVTKLANFKSQFKDFLINPSELGSFLLLKFSGESVLAHSLTKKFDVLNYYTTKTFYKKDQINDLNQQIAFFSIAIINWLLGNSTATLHKILSIQHLNPINRSISKTNNNYLLYILRSETLKKTTKKNIQLDRILANHLNRLSYSTSFGDSVYHLIKIQKRINKRDYHLALKYAEKAIAEFKKNNYKILEIMVYQMIITIHTALDDIDKVNEYRYVILNTLELNSVTPYRYNIKFLQN